MVDSANLETLANAYQHSPREHVTLADVSTEEMPDGADRHAGALPSAVSAETS